MKSYEFFNHDVPFDGVKGTRKVYEEDPRVATRLVEVAQHDVQQGGHRIVNTPTTSICELERVQFLFDIGQQVLEDKPLQALHGQWGQGDWAIMVKFSWVGLFGDGDGGTCLPKGWYGARVQRLLEDGLEGRREFIRASAEDTPGDTIRASSFL